MEKLLLSTAYFPPVQYMSKIKLYDEIFIERYENFGKQSYRNRSEIMSANGIISLSVPVEKANSKTLIRDMKIVYQTNWQKLHFKGIESAYKNSPYYEYYIDDLMPFFEKKEKFLLDFNSAILEVMLHLLKLSKPIHYTEDYIRENIPGYRDMRNTIHPKAGHREEDTEFIPRPYRQTFSDRFPFHPNLSILDLLFNTGPEAGKYL